MPADVSAEAPADRPADVAVEVARDVAVESGVETPPETCEAVIAEYTRLVMAADRACTGNSDCRIEGNSSPGCEPAVLSIMCGVAVNAGTFPAARVDGLRQTASRLGCRSGWYDCGEWQAICLAGRCEMMNLRGCLPGPEPGRDGG